MATTYSGADIPTLMAFIANTENGGDVPAVVLNVTLDPLTLSTGLGVITGIGVDPSVTFEALLASEVPAFVLLAEIQPMEILGTWTAAGGGLTNTYYCNFPSQIATTFVPGGLYRRLDFVRQDNILLALRSSSTLVNSFPGSYFLDTALDRLYVSTTTGLSPDTYVLVGAWFSLFFSTSSVAFPDQPLYAPLITGQLPTIISEMPDQLFGSAISDTGALSLLNGDGLFDRLSQQYVWRNKTATIKLGGGGLTYLDFTTVSVLRINSLAVTDETATLQFEALGTVLNRQIPTRTFGDSTLYPNLGEGVGGRLQPWLLGVVRDCPLALIDTTGNGSYQVADLSVTPVTPTVDAVYAVDRSTKATTLLTAPTDYLHTAGTVTIVNPAYHHDTYDIWASLTWAEGSASFGVIAYTLLGYLGEEYFRMDLSALNALEVNTQVLGAYVMESMQASELMRTFEQSEFAQLYVKTNGLWSARSMTPDIPATYRELTDKDFVTWDAEPTLESVLSEVRVEYDYRPGSGTAFESASSSFETQYGSETTDSHRLFTYIIQDFNAAALAEHLRFFRSRPPTRIRFEERGLTLMGAQVGDLVSVKRERAPVARTGAYQGHFLRIVRLEKSLGPVPTVRGVLNDLDGQTDYVARYLDADVDLNWSSATDEQKARYGFYGDDNGYLVSADPLTRNAKVMY